MKKIIIGIVIGAVILCCGAVGFFLYQSKKQVESYETLTVKEMAVTTKERSFRAGGDIRKSDFEVEIIYLKGDEKVREILPANLYTIDIDRAPEMGREFQVKITYIHDSSKYTMITCANEREVTATYEIGKTDPTAVIATLYKNGELELTGKGNVQNFKERETPWYKDEVQYLSYIADTVMPESMDYWFSGSKSFIEMTCQVPDSVKSMIGTFASAELLQETPDMSQASSLLDMTGCYKNCKELKKTSALPVNVKIAKEAYSGCEKLTLCADASACRQLDSMEEMYSGCSALSTTSTPDTVRNLRNAYMDCVNIEMVRIPSKAVSLDNMCRGCKHLEIVNGEIPATCTSLGGAFADCPFLTGDLKMKLGMENIYGILSGSATSGGTLTLSVEYVGTYDKEDTETRLKERLREEADRDGSNIVVQ